MIGFFQWIWRIRWRIIIILSIVLFTGLILDEVVNNVATHHVFENPNIYETKEVDNGYSIGGFTPLFVWIIGEDREIDVIVPATYAKEPVVAVGVSDFEIVDDGWISFIRNKIIQNVAEDDVQLRSIELSEGIQYLDSSLLTELPYLREIVIPRSIRQMDDGAYVLLNEPSIDDVAGTWVRSGIDEQWRKK